MQMAFVLAANQVVSHGFGLFLFSALFPLMREPLGLNHWYLTTAGITTQVAYLAGALSVGFLGRWVSAEKLVLITGATAGLLLLSLFVFTEPYVMIGVLFGLVFSAAVSWSAIVGLISRFAPPESAASRLTLASSGTAWGYGINGLILLWWVPVFGWQSVWAFVAAIASVVWLVTLIMVRGLLRKQQQGPLQEPLKDREQKGHRSQSPSSESSEDIQNDDSHNADRQVQNTGRQLEAAELVALTTRQLLLASFTEQRAFFSCLIYFLVGMICMTFTGWLNTYLDELEPMSSLAGSTWSVIGISGMACGLLIGRLADKKGHDVTLLLMAAGFALGLTVFSFDPLSYAFLAGASYGLMYFPVWGVLSSWLSQRYSPIATMQLSGIGMVASAIGGSLGNVLAGQILNQTGSLALMYDLLAVAGALLVLITAVIYWRGKSPSVVSVEPC